MNKWNSEVHGVSNGSARGEKAGSVGVRDARAGVGWSHRASVRSLQEGGV